MSDRFYIGAERINAPDLAACSAPAIVAHLRGLSYCARYDTDGLIPKAIAQSLAPGPGVLKELLTNDVWRERVEVYFLPDYPMLNKRRTKIEAQRKAARERMRRLRGPATSPAPSVPTEPAMGTKAGGVASREAAKSTEATPSVLAGSPPAAGAPPEAVALCEQLADAIASHGVARPRIGKKWHDAARLLITSDGYTLEQVAETIDWLRTGTDRDAAFWRGNILSMPKLREKFAQLVLKRQSLRPAASDAAAETLRRAQELAEEGL